MPRRAWALWLLVGSGCIDELNQVAGTGATYTTRCSSEMDVHERQYKARCVPETCAAGFRQVGSSDVVVAVDPGRKVVGYAERVCIQDLSNASALFDPARFEEGTTTVRPEGSEEVQVLPPPE